MGSGPHMGYGFVKLTILVVVLLVNHMGNYIIGFIIQ